MKRLASIVVAAAVFAVIAQVVHTAGAFLTMGYYTDPAYACLWSKAMMPSNGPPPAGFFLLAIGISFFTGAVYSWVFGLLKASIPGSTPLRRGVAFGALVFLVGGLPGNLGNFILLNLPVALSLSWTVETLVASLAGGAVIGLLLK